MLFKRAIAIFIDSILISIIGGIVGAVIGQEAGSFISLFIGITYQVVMLTQNNGQTLGKMLLGIRVVKEGGGSISALSAALRYVGYILNTVLFFTGWILAVITGRGFHDYLAGTKVVDA